MSRSSRPEGATHRPLDGLSTTVATAAAVGAFAVTIPLSLNALVPLWVAVALSRAKASRPWLVLSATVLVVDLVAAGWALGSWGGATVDLSWRNLVRVLAVLSVSIVIVQAAHVARARRRAAAAEVRRLAAVQRREAQRDKAAARRASRLARSPKVTTVRDQARRRLAGLRDSDAGETTKRLTAGLGARLRRPR
ncbi:MAG: hypothetical protein M3O28_05675 [Actinomycetota bacterium]|nr:hypothetical protein [Actinomycetota bacterium]